jgi:hypothetical protein
MSARSVPSGPLRQYHGSDKTPESQLHVAGSEEYVRSDQEGGGTLAYKGAKVRIDLADRTGVGSGFAAPIGQRRSAAF